MHGHTVAKSTYYQIAGWLFLLMILTVAAGSYDLGPWNTPIALVIAITKAVLIVLFFMHVRYGSPLLRLFAAGGFLWLMILLSITMADYLTR